MPRRSSAPSDREAVRVLAVSDETSDELLASPDLVRSARLILACGDLPFDYLDALLNALEVPLVFVPGGPDPAGGPAGPGAVAGGGAQRRPPDPRRGRAAGGRPRRLQALQRRP